MDFIFSVLRIGVLAFAGLCLLLYFKQDGMIFIGAKLASGELEELRRRFPGSELRLTTPDGTRLHGWYLRADSNEPAPLLIHFGGNAEDVSYMLLDREHFPGISLLLVNYRGYGLSEGRPGQKSLTGDALFLYDQFSTRPEVDPKRIILMGRSLGTGVAAHLASRRQVDRLVLISPYDSLRSLARGIYPWLPISVLLKHPFDSIKLAPDIQAPMLAVVAGRDGIIPPEHSRALVEAWGGEADLVEVKGADHNDLALRREFWEPIEKFTGVARR